MKRPGIRARARTTECEHPDRYPDEPHGYFAWFVWAEQKARTHVQRRCPHCGLYAIWEPIATRQG